MRLVLDPIATLERQTLVFRSHARPETEVAPCLGRQLPTGGVLFHEAVRARLAMIAGLTVTDLLPAGGAPPRIDVSTDRSIQVKVQHEDPAQGARQTAASLWRRGHACRVEERVLGQVEVVLERLPLSLRFVPDRSALVRHLSERFEGQRRQWQAATHLSG